MAHAAPPSSYAAYSKTFRCPETLPSDEARTNALRNFLAWAAQNDPDVTVEKVAQLRTRLLAEHHCNETMANIRSAAPREGNASRNLCVGDDAARYFSNQLASNCTSVPSEQGWVNLHTDRNMIVDVLPSRIVRDREGTKLWAQFFLAEPASSKDGQWSYDHVKSITRFRCKSKQQVLIQGTYSLDGQPMYERASTESIAEEIEPGTLAEKLYDYACRKK
jgi:hypothetical protein